MFREFVILWILLSSLIAISSPGYITPTAGEDEDVIEIDPNAVVSPAPDSRRAKS